MGVRTVRADIERLRSLDYTIDGAPGVGGGYRLRAGTRLPPLPLDDDEAMAVAVALRIATTSGLADLGDHSARAAAKLERWYLVGYDLDRTDWRSFRVDRIKPKTPTGPRFPPRELPRPDLATFVTRGRMAAMWNYRARVTVYASAETVATRIPTGVWTVERLDAIGPASRGS